MFLNVSWNFKMESYLESNNCLDERVDEETFTETVRLHRFGNTLIFIYHNH